MLKNSRKILQYDEVVYQLIVSLIFLKIICLHFNELYDIIDDIYIREKFIDCARCIRGK